MVIWSSGYIVAIIILIDQGSILLHDTFFNKLIVGHKLIQSAQICSEMVSSDQILLRIISVRSDQNWSESDLKIWPCSLPCEVRKILSGF